VAPAQQALAPPVAVPEPALPAVPAELALAQAQQPEAAQAQAPTTPPAEETVMRVTFGEQAPRPPGPGQPALYSLPEFQQLVTMDFKNADLQDVIRLVSARTGLNVLMSPGDVRGQVTLHLENIPLGPAFDSILKTNRLAFIQEEGGIIRIVPEERVGRREVEVVTEVIELNWRNARDIEQTFKEIIQSQSARTAGIRPEITANEEAQVVIVTAAPPDVQRLRELIKFIDRPDRQVSIEARLVDITETALRGLTKQFTVSKIDSDVTNRIAPLQTLMAGGEGGPPTIVDTLTDISGPLFVSDPLFLHDVVTEGVDLTAGIGTLSFGTDVHIFGNDYDINAILTALEQRRFAEILANPKVTTLNNVQANIRIVQRIPFIEAVQGPTQGTTVAEVEFEDAGITIRVKPIVTPDGHVRLDMQLQETIFRGRVGGGGAATNLASPPIIDERTAGTTVIVKDNETIVFGGLRQINKSAAIDGVPWLYRIPVLGGLFRDSVHEQDRFEIVLMVTPHVIDSPIMTDNEKQLYDAIDVSWHLPDYFFDDVSDRTDLKYLPPLKP